MADPTLTNSGSGTASTADVTASFGFTATYGRLLVFIVGSDDYVTVDGDPNGWTQVTGSDLQGFLGHAMWFRVAAGTETSVAFTIGSATSTAWIILEWDNTSLCPFEVSSGQFTNTTASTYTTTSITPAATSRKLVLASIGGSSSAGDFTDIGTWLNSYTERGEAINNGAATNDAVGVASLIVDGGSSTSSGATYTNPGAVQSRTALIASFKNLTEDLFPIPVHLGEVGNAANTTGAASTAVTTTDVARGDLCVAWVSVDNSGSSGAAPGLTVTDSRSNTWTVETVSNNDPGAANAGVSGYIAWSKITTAIVASDTITFTWGAGNPPAKAISVQAFRNVKDSAVATGGTTGASTTPSATVTPTRSFQLVCGLIAIEGGLADTWSMDTDTTDGIWAYATRRGAGTTTSGQTAIVAWKISSGTSAQTLNSTITSRDWATKAVVFDHEDVLPWAQPTRPSQSSQIVVRQPGPWFF